MTDLPMTKADDELVERKHTPTPWFVSGTRFRMNGSEWHGINRYNETKTQDENIACVGYDPRTGDGFADAHFIVEAVNNYDSLRAQLAAAEAERDALRRDLLKSVERWQAAESQLQAMRKALEEIARPRSHSILDSEAVAREALRSLTEGAGKC